MTPITIHDPVYGDVTFTEPLFIDLYHADAVQRLTAIYQGGVTAFIKPQRATTRLEHCLGVAALLRLLGADPVEQAAGLLHDVPHTAFSHVVDFVFPNHAHTYHEEHREDMLGGSEIPGICARHGLDWRYVSDADNFTLLEQPPPVSADRLDYFLRDGTVDVGTFSPPTRALCWRICVFQEADVVDDPDAARWLGEQFIRLDDAGVWRQVGWYAVLRARVLALALGVMWCRLCRNGRRAVERIRAANAPGHSAVLALLWRDGLRP